MLLIMYFDLACLSTNANYLQAVCHFWGTGLIYTQHHKENHSGNLPLCMGNGLKHAVLAATWFLFFWLDVSCALSTLPRVAQEAVHFPLVIRALTRFWDFCKNDICWKLLMTPGLWEEDSPEDAGLCLPGVAATVRLHIPPFLVVDDPPNFVLY